MYQVTPIAFYLPQYHPIRVNDINWGDGFSDWHNVVRGSPLFENHLQPRLPGKLGFYDLRTHEVMIEQAQLARAYGIGAFCFYYYRFGSLRVMERPVEGYLNNRQPDMPFIYCWANESWTRAWDGRSDAELLNQTYDDETINGLCGDLTQAIMDGRYFRINGQPLFLIYQADLLPDGQALVERLKCHILEHLGEELIVGAVYSPQFNRSMLDWLDLVVQFPPHRLPRPYERMLVDASEVSPYFPQRNDRFERYEDVMRASLDGAHIFDGTLLGVTPNWDNSPRRPNGAHILIGSTPEKFKDWVSQVTRLTCERYASDLIKSPIFFVNAWNEWAEGAILEPTMDLGLSYLGALADGVREGLAGLTSTADLAMQSDAVDALPSEQKALIHAETRFGTEPEAGSELNDKKGITRFSKPNRL